MICEDCRFRNNKLRCATCTPDVLNKALELFIQWAVEYGFGYDNLGDLLKKYEFVIEDYGYTGGLKYIVLEEALTALGVRGERECL